MAYLTSAPAEKTGAVYHWTRALGSKVEGCGGTLEPVSDSIQSVEPPNVF